MAVDRAHERSNIVSFMTPSAPCEKSMFVGFGESMVTRLKLEGINGRAPPREEPAASFDSTRKTHQVLRSFLML